MLGRLVAKNLSESLGVSVIVENRTGAGGTIGTDHVAKSAPDGLTLLLGATGPVSVGKALYPKLPYDPAKDLTPIALISRVPFVVVAHPDQPFKNIADIVAAAKAKPNSITYGSAGNGTPQHIIGEMFKQATNTELTHVPYRGSAPATIDLLGNQVAIMFDNPGPLVQHIKTGRLKALAQTGPTRSAAFPDVPTMSEAGLKGFVATPWYGIMGPANMPPAIAEKLNKEINASLGKPDVIAKLAEAGLTTSLMSLREMRTFLDGESIKWGDAARRSNASLD
ncbi:tripartite tricarboxylate transporter substrate binding protein [Lacisediminimonas sp.]|uniref:Bug family tripartite tricarboxylate transporter substrate binding protein n=1 Tax=Lacisediminimonas sp. TaxID=3060582 RepID=UPI002718268B|nr:tripartite tricarboxylate transporter substrate binding protein [Lacisediminimonas sp.]MDO8301019.1 tripartite tricarboxylate transporter substrate binding protein [Lacisediminimonas sp.]